MPLCTSPSSQPTGRRAVAEGHLAGGGGLDPHLVLEIGGVHPVALAGQLAGLQVEVMLRHDEQAKALGARTACPLDADRPGQHQVHDVLGQVVLAGGDEALDALEVPGPVRLRDRLGPPGADVGAGVRLGQHHRRVPPRSIMMLGDPLVPLGAVRPEHGGELRSGAVEADRRVGAEVELADRPLHRVRGHLPAELGRQLQGPGARVHQRLERGLERLRQRHRMGLRVEDRRLVLADRERVGQLGPGQVVGLGQDRRDGLPVQVGVRLAAQDGLPVAAPRTG